MRLSVFHLLPEGGQAVTGAGNRGLRELADVEMEGERASGLREETGETDNGEGKTIYCNHRRRQFD